MRKLFNNIRSLKSFFKCSFITYAFPYTGLIFSLNHAIIRAYTAKISQKTKI